MSLALMGDWKKLPTVHESNNSDGKAQIEGPIVLMKHCIIYQLQKLKLAALKIPFVSRSAFFRKI